MTESKKAYGLAILLAIACLFFHEIKAQALYDYPTRAVLVPLQGQIYSPLTWEQARKGVPEIRIISKEEAEIEFIGDKKDEIDVKLWQESPTRIIYHDGKYHMWLMHLIYWGDNREPFQGTNYHLTSVDGLRWKVESEFPKGEPGGFDTEWREGCEVIVYQDKFWMFYAGNASDEEKYGVEKRNGDKRHAIGLLVADQPEGPWVQATDEPLFSRSDDPDDWDYDMVNNPHVVYFDGKWFIYYKSRNMKRAGSNATLTGVAVAESITGPYMKYHNNPVFEGHGVFTWVYRGGITMLPFLTGGKIHWSPDGLHWHNVDDPATRGITTPIFSGFYLPHDPLSGTPVTSEEPDEFWGIETRLTENYIPIDWSVFWGKVTFNPVVEPEEK